MPTSGAERSKRDTLNLRIRPELRSLIDRAAKARGKNRTEFVLEAARSAAEEALLDQTIIAASPEAYEAFLARLDMPPRPNDRLRKTMQTRPPWNKA
ncbi:DUF1778 domain-containing protein [Inquilinus sp. Marseille-Q2685]|uniref:type II toxin-antitoxin system TacA family antitoxin n=1 Tax=Inquilinus sp. Marseille-Q2685 TaxID=2866581 RepID=UPI001CE43848|nr:DUF1778 domain-containing protein [Inquilinus sp. Marseille-Q2685]